MTQIEDGKIVRKEVPALTAMNMRLRDDYVKDASGGLKRWNKVISKAGIEFEMKLPHEGFHRQIGVFAGAPINAGWRYDQPKKNGTRRKTNGYRPKPMATSSSP